MASTTQHPPARPTDRPRISEPRIATRLLLALRSGSIRSQDLVKEEAERANCSESKVHNVLKELVEAGYVERTEHGRRTVDYMLTESGLSLLESEATKSYELLLEWIPRNKEGTKLSLRALALCISAELGVNPDDTKEQTRILHVMQKQVETGVTLLRKQLV